MADSESPDNEQTAQFDSKNDNPRQHGIPEWKPSQKAAHLVYSALSHPNPYHSPTDRQPSTPTGSFTILGDFCPASVPLVLDRVVSAVRQHTGGHTPYTFAEFQRLLANGTLLGVAPKLEDRGIYENDDVLTSLSDASPLFQLRKAFLYKEARQQYNTLRQHEEDLLNCLLAVRGSDHDDYQAYLAYLSTDHSALLAPFFREWRLPVSEFDRERHTLITAKTGYGKSELIKLAIHRDITRRRRPGVILLEPHGELGESVARLKENFGSDRLVYLDPTLNPSYSPVINPLEIADKSPVGIDRATEELLEVFRVVLSGTASPFTPNMETILLGCIATLMVKGNSTLFDLLDFMDDDANEELVAFGAKYLVNPAHHYLFTKDFRGEKYDSTKEAIKTKLYSFLSSNAIHDFLIGKSTINLKEAMDSGKLIVLRLPKHLGPRSIEAIGRFFTAAVQNTAFERAKEPEEKRKPVFMYIDESHRFISPIIENILTDARKYKLHLTFSTQILGQDADSQLKRIISSCTNVKITGANDFKSLSAISRETGLEVEKMRDLAVGEFYVKAGDRPNIKFKAPSYLQYPSAYMTDAQWESTKAEQLARYYRKIDRRQPSPEKAAIGSHSGRRPGLPIEI